MIKKPYKWDNIIVLTIIIVCVCALGMIYGSAIYYNIVEPESEPSKAINSYGTEEVLVNVPMYNAGFRTQELINYCLAHKELDPKVRLNCLGFTKN